MYKALFTFLILFTITAKGQSTNSIIGDWKFIDVNNAKTMDSTKRATLKKLFGELEIHLKSDKTYSAMFFKKEEGKWSYDDSLQILTLATDKKEDKINIIKITDKNLTLELKKGVDFILEKITPK